ncbi:MAG: hypothetical protein WCC06_04995 [Candidatus Aminicenantales bacterium]
MIHTPRKAKRISLTVASPVVHQAEVRVGRQERRARISPEERWTVLSPVGFPWKGGYLYSVRVRNSSGFYPFRLERDSTDNRFLGVFVKIEPEYYYGEREIDCMLDSK